MFPIVRGASLRVPMGEVTVLLGGNGAGKTTLLEAISAVIPTARGHLELGGTSLDKLNRRERVRRGLGHVEQGRRIFPELTTEENLVVAARGDWSLRDALTLFPELEPRLAVRADLLSGGEQQMLVVARTLAAQPKVLMVDEMSLGLAPRVASRLIATMRTLADQGFGVLLVEQFADLALNVGDTVYVLTQGEIVYSGACRTLLEQPDILRRAYLGERVDTESTPAAGSSPDRGSQVSGDPEPAPRGHGRGRVAGI